MSPEPGAQLGLSLYTLAENFHDLSLGQRVVQDQLGGLRRLHHLVLQGLANKSANPVHQTLQVQPGQVGTGKAKLLPLVVNSLGTGVPQSWQTKHQGVQQVTAPHAHYDDSVYDELVDRHVWLGWRPCPVQLEELDC